MGRQGSGRGRRRGGEVLYHDCDEETLEWALGTRRPFVPSAVFEERIELNATEDRTIRPDWDRRMARERLGVEPVELTTGHCPNVSRPAGLAETLLALDD